MSELSEQPDHKERMRALEIRRGEAQHVVALCDRATAIEKILFGKSRGGIHHMSLHCCGDIQGKSEGPFDAEVSTVSHECRTRICDALTDELKLIMEELASSVIDDTHAKLSARMEYLQDFMRKHGLDVEKKSKWKLSTLLKHIAGIAESMPENTSQEQDDTDPIGE